MEKTTLVLGASPNPERFSNKAVLRLLKRGIPVFAVGKREGTIGGLKINRNFPEDNADIHTVTLYMNAVNQKENYEKIISLKPKRIIFNPGTLNPELAALANNNGIAVIESCMLEMLSSGRF
jgi:predicted CoA-binding protein